MGSQLGVWEGLISGHLVPLLRLFFSGLHPAGDSSQLTAPKSSPCTALRAWPMQCSSHPYTLVGSRAQLQMFFWCPHDPALTLQNSQVCPRKEGLPSPGRVPSSPGEAVSLWLRFLSSLILDIDGLTCSQAAGLHGRRLWHHTALCLLSSTHLPPCWLLFYCFETWSHILQPGFKLPM